MEILDSLMIKTSIINGQDRGVSMSSNLKLWSHGPFKFIFKPELAWYAQFQQCTYLDGLITPLNKPHFFQDEQEWLSYLPIIFELLDLEQLIFMSDSPGARIHPKIAIRRWAQVQQKYRTLLTLTIDSTYYGG